MVRANGFWISMTGILTGPFRWVALAVGIWCIAAALAGSQHHWLSWLRGQVSHVDTSRHTFAIFLTGRLDVVKWTSQTRIWTRNDSTEGMPFDVEVLKGEPQVAVLVEEGGREKIARRIVMLSGPSVAGKQNGSHSPRLPVHTNDLINSKKESGF